MSRTRSAYACAWAQAMGQIVYSFYLGCSASHKCVRGSVVSVLLLARVPSPTAPEDKEPTGCDTHTMVQSA